jgi:hypothetical protein
LQCDQADSPTKSGPARSLAGWSAPLALSAMLLLTSPVARAADGCLVLLCFAAPSWRAIPQCVPPIREVLRDLARGRPFPTCAMAGPSNSASHQWSSAPGNCPPQYTRVTQTDNGPVYSCDYDGAVSVAINGAAFARTWWSMAGDTVTEFSAGAKVQLGNWDSRFEDDYAVWLASLPPPPAPADSGQ